MPGTKTKWPRFPDPRSGYFGARGYDPPYALPYKIKIQNPTINEITLAWLEKGSVMELYSTTESETIYWTPRLDPLESRAFFWVYGFNPNTTAPMGGSLYFYLQFQILTIAYYESRIEATWPPGGYLPPTFICLELFPNPLPMLGGVQMTAMPWDTPTGDL